VARFLLSSIETEKVRMLVALLPVAAVLVFGTAYLAVSMAPPGSRVGRWLALWIAVWTEVVLTVEALSLLASATSRPFVTPLGFLVCYVVFAGAVVIVWRRRGMPRMRLLTLPVRQEDTRLPLKQRGKKKHSKRRSRLEPGPIIAAPRAHTALTLLLVVLAVCALTNLLLAVGLPVNNYDSITYHLSRVGYWIQHGSTAHYYTHNERQNYSPPNAEFGLLSMMVFARAEWPATLAQYAAYFICIAAVYLIARQPGACDAAALFAALILGTMTEIVLQSTIPKNGLVVTSFLACSLAFALIGLRGQTGTGEAVSALVWSGLAVGLAIGTKATAPLFVPGLAIAGVVVAVMNGGKVWLRRTAVWAACCLAGVVLLGSFNYVRNSLDYGSISGPPETVRLHRIERPSWRGLSSNLARYGYMLDDWGGIIPRSLGRKLTGLRADEAPAVFRALGITANAPELNFLDHEAEFPVDPKTGRFDDTPRLHEDTAWFGPIAFFVGLPLVLVHLVYSPIRKNWPRFAVALAPVVYWLLVCALLRYQIWGGRFFVTAAVLGAPLLALAYQPTRLPVARHAITWLLALTGVSTAVTATFYNPMKPIIPRPVRDEETDSGNVRGVLEMPRLLQRTRTSEAAHEFLSAPEDEIPARMTLGIVIGSNDADWYMFGPHLTRRIVPLPPDRDRIVAALKNGEVDKVLISKAIPFRTLPPIFGEILRGHWSFLAPEREQTAYLLPTRDWNPRPDAPWAGPDHLFLPARPLPAGTIVVGIEPNPAILAETQLVFEFFQGQRKIGVEEFAAGKKFRRIVLPWEAADTEAGLLLRIRVTSPNKTLNARLYGPPVIFDVYKLVEPPRFRPQ
jgi:hypothetical protein